MKTLSEYISESTTHKMTMSSYVKWFFNDYTEGKFSKNPEKDDLFNVDWNAAEFWFSKFDEKKWYDVWNESAFEFKQYLRDHENDKIEVSINKFGHHEIKMGMAHFTTSPKNIKIL